MELHTLFIKKITLPLLLLNFLNIQAESYGMAAPRGFFGHNPSTDLLSYRHQQDAGYLHFSHARSYTTHKNGLGKLLFFNGKNSMKISSTPRTEDQNTDIYAVNLLVGGVFNSIVTANPRIETRTFDTQFLYNLDPIIPGLYTSFTISYVSALWKHGINEVVSQQAGTFVPGDVNNGTPITTNTSASSFFVSQRTAGQAEAAIYGKLTTDIIKKRCFGNNFLKIGYRIIESDTRNLSVEGHLLLNGSGPSRAKYWFEPSVGTAGQQGIGLGTQFYQALFTKNILNDDGSITKDYSVDLFINAQLTYLFGRTGKHSFDVTRHGAGSRYMLAKKKANLATAFAATDTVTPAINYTTLSARTGVDLLVQTSTFFTVTLGQLKMDFGYQFFAHTKERLKKWHTDINAILGMKAISATNFGGADINNVSTDIQIHGANPFGQTANLVPFSTASSTIRRDDLHLHSGLRPSEVSHVFVYNLEYGWKDRLTKMPVNPFVGIGTAYETGGTNNSLNQWHFFVNTGLTF